MAGDGREMPTKQERERQFHDVAFSEGTRERIWGFYDVTGASRRAFSDALLVAQPRGKEVLEFGCGLDAHSTFLAQQGARVTGIDISPVAVEEGRRHAEKQEQSRSITFEVMNAESLAFTDHTFDLVCGSAVLHHLDLTLAYGEIARVLKPGGIAVFLEPLGHNPFINAYRRRTPGLRTVDEHPLRKGDFELARNWFADVQVDYFHLATLAAIPLRRRRQFGAIVDALDKVDRRVFRLAPATQKHAWMAVLRFAGPQPLPSRTDRRPAASPRASS